MILVKKAMLVHLDNTLPPGERRNVPPDVGEGVQSTLPLTTHTSTVSLQVWSPLMLRVFHHAITILNIETSWHSRMGPSGFWGIFGVDIWSWTMILMSYIIVTVND